MKHQTLDLTKLASDQNLLVQAMAQELEGRHPEVFPDLRWGNRFIAAGPKNAPPRWATRFVAAGLKQAPTAR